MINLILEWVIIIKNPRVRRKENTDRDLTNNEFLINEKDLERKPKSKTN